MMKLLGGASTDVYVGDTNVAAGTDITYWISGDAGGIESGGADENNYTVKYDPTDGVPTITLNNATITTTYTDSDSKTYGIYTGGDLKLVLKGNNTVGNSINQYGVGVSGTLTISDGDSDSDRLTVVGRTNGIVASSITYIGGLLVAKGNTQAMSVEVQDGAATPSVVSPLAGGYNKKFAVWGPENTYTVLNETLNLEDNTSSSDWSDSTNSRGWKWDYNSDGGSTLTLKNVIINGQDNTSYAYGVMLPSNSKVVLEGVNVVSAGDVTSYEYGTTCGVTGGGTQTIEGNGTLISLAGKKSGNGSKGIAASSGVTIGMGSDAPTVTAISTNKDSGYGFIMGNITGFVVNSGTVIAIGNYRGISAQDKYIINGGAVTASAGNKAMDNIPTFGNNLGITAGTWDGKFMRTGEGGMVSYPIWVGNTQVTSTNKNDVLGDGKVVYTLPSSEMPQKLTLSGADITETYLSNNYRYGIYSKDALQIALKPGTINSIHGPALGNNIITISGAGTLRLTAGNTTDNDTGITVYGRLAISEATVEATGSYGTKGVSDLTVDKGGMLKATGTVMAMNKAPNLSGSYQWRTSSTGGFTLNTQSPYVWSNSHTYVEIKSTSYIVTYKAGTNGLGTQASDTKTPDEALTLKGEIFTREGFTQTGWATSEGGVKAYDLGGSYNDNVGRELYPVWTENSYKITYNPGVGKLEADAPSVYTYGVETTLPTLSKDGYSFVGWYTNEGCTQGPITKIEEKDTGDKIYWAKWTQTPIAPIYTVSFDSNGGNTISSMTDIPLNTTITLPTPIRANYRFEGWYEGNVQYTNSTPITKNVTLVAKWSYIGTNSGGNSGGSTTSTSQKTTKERIASLSSSQKQAVANYFKEELPYTTINPSFVEEALKRLTDKHFTDAQVKEILGDKALLKELGIESHRAISQITLKPMVHATFTDVATNHWAYEAIKEAAALGLVAGMPDDSFAPNSPLQVADTFTFLDRVLILNNINGMKLPRSTVEKYLTNKEHWAFASMASIASKLSEATLKTISELGDKPLSRELLTQVLYEVTDGKLEPIKESIAFEDTANSPYKEAIDYCVRAGLISGVDRTHMAPTKSVTRAELMIVLIRLDNALK